MNNLFIFFKMAIKIAESVLKRRVDRVSGNTGIFFFRPNDKIEQMLSFKTAEYFAEIFLKKIMM